MATGENILWIVTRKPEFYGEADKHYIFRTRKAANEFQERKNRKSKRYWYNDPRRATWGPDNVQ